MQFLQLQGTLVTFYSERSTRFFILETQDNDTGSQYYLKDKKTILMKKRDGHLERWQSIKE